MLPFLARFRRTVPVGILVSDRYICDNSCGRMYVLDRLKTVPLSSGQLHHLRLQPMLRRIAGHRLGSCEGFVVCGYPCCNTGLRRVAPAVVYNSAYQLVVVV